MPSSRIREEETEAQRVCRTCTGCGAHPGRVTRAEAWQGDSRPGSLPTEAMKEACLVKPHLGGPDPTNPSILPDNFMKRGPQAQHRKWPRVRGGAGQTLPNDLFSLSSFMCYF